MRSTFLMKSIPNGSNDIPVTHFAWFLRFTVLALSMVSLVWTVNASLNDLPQTFQQPSNLRRFAEGWVLLTLWFQLALVISYGLATKRIARAWLIFYPSLLLVSLYIYAATEN